MRKTQNRNAGDRGPGVEMVVHSENGKHPTSSKPRGAAQLLVASISKSHSCQFRVSISSWCGLHKIELADFTSVVAGIYFQAGAGVTLRVEHIDELLAAITAVKTEVRARGMLP